MDFVEIDSLMYLTSGYVQQRCVSFRSVLPTVWMSYFWCQKLNWMDEEITTTRIVFLTPIQGECIVYRNQTLFAFKVKHLSLHNLDTRRMVDCGVFLIR